MTKDKDIKTVVPPLRFPEFRDAPKWGETKLHKLSKRITQKNTQGAVNRVLTNSASDGIVDQRDYFDKDIANQNNLEGYYIVEEGDYVYNPRISNIAPVGPLSKNRIGTGVMSPLYMVFRFDNNSNDFYAQYFQSPNWHKYLKEVSNKGARFDRMSITPNVFMDMPIPATTIQEQKKIADCLGRLDNLRSAVVDKIETLKLHKKSLMQQLFPAEGKTTPALRFPEFQNAGEWKENSIGSVCESFSGGTPKTSEKEYYGGEIPFIRSAEINKEKTELFLTECGLKNSAAKLVNKGDILVALYGANSGDVAISKIDGAINQAILCLKSKGSNSFIYHYISFKKENIIATYIQGGQGNLSGEIIKSIRLPSTTPKEQKRIADCLSSVDELISAETNKLDQLKAHKKGLMQQLFPIINE